MSSLKNNIRTLVLGREGSVGWRGMYMYRGRRGLKLRNLSVRTLLMTPRRDLGTSMDLYDRPCRESRKDRIEIIPFTSTGVLRTLSSIYDKALCENSEPFKRQSHKMVKQTQTFCRLLPSNCLSVFDHFVGLVLKELMTFNYFRKIAPL